MYARALVATDGSSIAQAVYRHVPQVVEPEGNVLVVEVIDDIAQVFARSTPAGFEVGSVGYNAGVAEQVVAAQRAAAEQHLEEARKALEASGLQHVETAILTGSPGEAIVREAGRHGAEIVLMGTHGRSGLRRTVLGSVADHVLRHLDGIPALLVHTSER